MISVKYLQARVLDYTLLMTATQENIVVACTTHHEKNSRLKALLGNSKVKIILLSDGTLVSDRKDPLAGTNDGINLNGAKFQYFFPEERFFVLYRLLTLITVLSSLIFFATIIEWSERMVDDDIGVESDDFLEHLQYFSPVCIWIFFDLVRGRFGTQERLVVKAKSGQNVEIMGGLPYQSQHNISMYLLGVSLLFVAALITPEESMFASILGLVILIGIASLYGKGITFLTVKSDTERSLPLNHFYFALTKILQDDPVANKEVEQSELDEFNKIREKLEKHQPLLDDVASSKEIFASKSPSLIVIAIGATTERLMRKACDSLGISRKHNARPTLHTYINEYQTKKSLDEKSLTQLNLIKEFRNRATHHFNIEWDESFIVLNQFCQFVEWYASTHSATDMVPTPGLEPGTP
jgi:hypothetical protein